jgi:hypothetical protein
MNAPPLPDFLRLQPHEITREKERQETLRKDFNSRVRLSPAEHEMARALILEADLKNAIKTADTAEAIRSAKNRYAECLAQLGRFLEAAKFTSDPEAQKFYTATAEAVFNGQECSCSPPIEKVGNQIQRLPKYRTIKEVHSLKHGQVMCFRTVQHVWKPNRHRE